MTAAAPKNHSMDKTIFDPPQKDLIMFMTKYLEHGHYYSCAAFARKGDPKYPCNCGYEQAKEELEHFRTDYIVAARIEG
jgi:hypothetical protein